MANIVFATRVIYITVLGERIMANLTKASEELFRRPPDERYDSLQSLAAFCQRQKEESVDRWHHPGSVQIDGQGKLLSIKAGNDGAYLMNDWSFSQICRMAGVAKDTVNRLSPVTAGLVLKETLPIGTKPIQLLTEGETIRSVHGTQYTRLWNADLVNVLQEFAVDFQPPQKGMNGATGLYAGEQDMFAFLIDPLGWCEINGDGIRARFFRLELGGRKACPRRSDVLDAGSVPEPHRLGCDRSRCLDTQAHGEGGRRSLRNPEDHCRARRKTRPA
jgi:hypothetical protein